MAKEIKEQGISEELQELVDSKKISQDEAKLLQAIRNNEIENPIKEKVSVKPTKVKEVTAIVEKTLIMIDIGENLIEKVNKSIDMLGNPKAMLFEDQELLNMEDKKHLSVLNEGIRDLLQIKVEQLKETLGGLKQLREQLGGYATDITMLYEQSEEISERVVEKALEKMDEKEEQNQTQNQGQKL